MRGKIDSSYLEGTKNNNQGVKLNLAIYTVFWLFNERKGERQFGRFCNLIYWSVSLSHQLCFWLILHQPISKKKTFQHLVLKMSFSGLPWWRSVWESACQYRGHGFEPWSGKIPHAAEQLGPWATTTEPACLEPVLRNKRGRDSERPAHRDEEWPPLATTRESPCTETKTQHS